MSKKNDLKAELEEKGIEFDPKAKIAELEALNAEDDAPVDSVEPSDEVPAEPVKSKFIEGKFIEGSPIMSATPTSDGYIEIKSALGSTFKISEAEYEKL